MNDTIVCPHCKKTIPLTQALSHQVQEKYAKFYKVRLEEEKAKLAVTLKEDALKKAKEELALQMKDKANEIEELRKQNKALQEQLLEINKSLRQLKTNYEERMIEKEKQLTREQDKIRIEEKRKADEEYKLKILEKDKKLDDAMKMVDDYKRKLEQGSQQLQGEVLELELENILRREFPYDEIKEVPKGVKGADVLQIVKNNNGKVCGTIIWESKRTKAWSEGWVLKLKEDQRQLKADLAVIISQVLPGEIRNISLHNGVWISNFESMIGLALALRGNLIELAGVKSSLVGKQDKKEILWNYLTSVDFRQRVEAIYDAYSQMLNDLKKEKDWFTKKWAKQEKNITRVADNILGMHGDLEGIVGKSLPEIKELQKLESGK